MVVLQEPGKSRCGGGPRVDRHVEDRSWWWVVINVVVMIPLVITDDAISNGNIVKDEDENNYGVTSSLSLKLVDQCLDLVLHLLVLLLLVLLLLVLHLALWRIWKKVKSYKHNNIHRL